ncbi:hypothetical protein ACFPRL_26955 [Pseudoclavibacter helvolus]
MRTDREHPALARLPRRHRPNPDPEGVTACPSSLNPRRTASTSSAPRSWQPSSPAQRSGRPPSGAELPSEP